AARSRRRPPGSARTSECPCGTWAGSRAWMAWASRGSRSSRLRPAPAPAKHLATHHLPYAGHDPVDVDQGVLLDGELGPGHVEARDPDDRRLQVVHRLLGDDRGYFGCDTGGSLRL